MFGISSFDQTIRKILFLIGPKSCTSRLILNRTRSLGRCWNLYCTCTVYIRYCVRSTVLGTWYLAVVCSYDIRRNEEHNRFHSLESYQNQHERQHEQRITSVLTSCPTARRNCTKKKEQQTQEKKKVQQKRQKLQIQTHYA